MNKFLKFFIAVVVALFPFLVINGLYIASEYSQGDSDIQKFKNMPENIQIANLGSSLGKFSFDYKNYPELNGFNMALLQQYLELDKSVLVQCKNKLSPNAVVMIIVGMIEYDSIPSEVTVSNVEKKYYQFLDYKNIPGCTVSKYLKLKFFPVVSASHPFKTIWSYYSSYFKSKKESEEENPDQNIKRFSENSPEKQVEISKSEFKRCFEPFPRAGKKGLLYNENLVFDMIEICRQNNLIPVVVSTPMTKTFLDLYPTQEGLLEVVQRFKDDLNKKYSDVKWLDYSFDADLSENPEYFMDPYHLNEDGALIFTDKVISDLRSLGILTK